jgi:hypothetical protein
VLILFNPWLAFFLLFSRHPLRLWPIRGLFLPLFQKHPRPPRPAALAALVVTDKKENKVAFPKDAANNGFIRRIKCGYLL